MHILDWPFLDALQLGALATLAITFGTDAISRRDRMMGWLAVACLLVGLRHGVLALSHQPSYDPDLLNRVQSLLVCFGFIALCKALSLLFSRQIPAAFPGWVALGMATNVVRNLFLSHPSLLNQWLLQLTSLTYLAACGAIILWILKARRDGDAMGRRIFIGFLGLTIPVVIEVAAQSLFGLTIRLSGLSIVILAIAIGTSWQWLVEQAMEERLFEMKEEMDLWHGLLPGTTFRTDQPSPLMEGLFGENWARKIKEQPESSPSLLGSDGVSYRIRSHLDARQERLGWCLRDDDTAPGASGFLSGWTVGLGMDAPEDSARIQAWLKAWGAEVQLWGTVPPREGPFPSLLIWAREPSILAVWREDDLQRRRPRWVQVGGPITEGPHVRLEAGVAQTTLKTALEGLLSRR